MGMKRGWDGDIYAALRDCLTALRLDPAHVKAQLRLVQCLIDLDWLSEATRCLENFKIRHPEFIKSKAFTQLQGDLQAAKAKKELKPKKKTSLPSAATPPVLSDFLRSSGEDATMDSDDDTDEEMEEVGEEDSKSDGSLSSQEVRCRL